MKFSLTKKIAVLVILPFIGALVALIAFRSYLQWTENDVEFINSAGKQRMISQSLLSLSIMVNTRHDKDNEALSSLIFEFEEGLNNLETLYEARFENFLTKKIDVLAKISQVENNWIELKPYLLAFANTTADDSIAVVAFEFIKSEVPNLTITCDNVVSEYQLAVKIVRSNTLTIFTVIFGLNFFILLFGIVATKRKIVRPVHLIEQAVKNIRRGNLNVRAPVITSDETASLAVSLNDLTDNIEQLVSDKEKEKQFKEKIFDTVPAGLAILISTGKIISINKRFEQMFPHPEGGIH